MALWVGIPNDMITFEGNETKKTELIEKLERHARLDAFMKGSYGNDESGENFKGCAVGCTLFSYGESVDDHSAYERLFGIPEEIARLEDRIFEGLPNEKSKDWPLRFSRAVPVGKDISGVAKAFKIRILEECLVYDRKAFPQVDKAVHLVIQALKGNGYLCAAESAAWSAARSAASAARSAAWSAAESAAWSAAYSAESAWSAAESAAWSAAYSAFEKLADILIECLESVD